MPTHAAHNENLVWTVCLTASLTIDPCEFYCLPVSFTLQPFISNLPVCHQTPCWCAQSTLINKKRPVAQVFSSIHAMSVAVGPYARLILFKIRGK